MKKADVRDFRIDCEGLYKSIFPRLAMKWKQYDSNQVRIEFTKWMMDHSMDRWKEAVDKKIRVKRARKERKRVAKEKEWLNDRDNNTVCVDNDIDNNCNNQNVVDVKNKEIDELMEL